MAGALTRDLSIGRRRRLAAVCGLVVLLATPTVSTVQAQSKHRGIDAALLPHGIGRGHLSPAVIVSWNSRAHDLAFAEDQFLTFKGQRALAMMHLAIHDALNAIVPVYDNYAYTAHPGPAHPIAAAAQAAHDVLLSQYPTQRTALSDELARWLADVPHGVLRDRGIALGQAAAAAVVTKREGDRWDVPGSYTFGEGPGRYQTTPSWNGFVAQPGFRFAKPFLLPYPQQFRPSPPPPLRTQAYVVAFREVMDYGAADSTRRTREQTDYALWWMEFAEGSVNRLARQLSTDRQLHLWEAARLFALVGVALYDTYVATWDAKYTYDHWRPYTAIRAAGADDNPDTMPNANWEPLRPTPPFPEYSSAHAAACAASFGMLADAFGRRVSFTMETTTAPPGMPTRTFTSFAAAAEECADSRVRLGWHFRYATDAGLDLGRRIAEYALTHALRERPH
jgi:hypothetical protein